jgi:hypothetical protein
MAFNSSDAASYQVLVQAIQHWDGVRTLHLCTVILTETVGNALLYGIIWYEHHGGMDQYKTVLNQLGANLSILGLTGKGDVQHAGPGFGSRVWNSLPHCPQKIICDFFPT